MPFIRLDKFFSSQEVLSRKEIKSFIKAGVIFINGVPALSPQQKVNSQKDVISIKGKTIPYKPFVYLMLNKPQGVVSATDDKIHKTVLDLVPPKLFRSDLFPAGRLDKDTVGFVLLTNDGEFAHEILSPKKHVAKTYQVRLDGPISNSNMCQLSSGVTLADGTVYRPAQLTQLEGGENPLVEVTITEGKYHQIKRMFGVVHLGVVWLKRTKIGELKLDPNLPEGCCREILHKDIQKILFK